MEATKDYPNLKPWKPGQSGNLNGRPVGTRQAFSAGFFRDLAEVGPNTAATRCCKQFALSLRSATGRGGPTASLPGNLSPSD